ncbi:MAG: hypothetical protein K1X64_21215 [Myxococcaceae bacterium]|nr:hypothetical protein [Myxococcaceae bacterium]
MSSRKIIHRGFVLVFLLGGAGCMTGAMKVPMTAAANMPAAEGTVTATRTSNENIALEVQVRHLAHPEKVEQGASTYVVWARPMGQAVPQILGALKVDRNLDGMLSTVTPYKEFQVFITAEPTEAAVTPTGQQLLLASVRPTAY